MRGLRGGRHLVVACETKLLLLEVGGGAPREVPRAVLDGRAPTALALLLSVSPLLLGARRACLCAQPRCLRRGAALTAALAQALAWRRARRRRWSSP